MSKVKSFLKQNKQIQETVDVKLDSFAEPVVIRVISGKEHERIEQRCMKNRPGQRGKQETYFDRTLYTRELGIASIVTPDLNNTELQESYGATGASELFNAMFTWGEQIYLMDQITLASGLEQSINDEIEEAKN